MSRLIVEVGDNVAAAYAGNLLARQGFEVVKLSAGDALARMSPHVRVGARATSTYEFCLDVVKDHHPLSLHANAGLGALDEVVNKAQLVLVADGAVSTTKMLTWASERVVVAFSPYGALAEGGPAAYSEASVYMGSGLGVFSRDKSGAPLVPRVPIASFQAGAFGALLGLALIHGDDVGFVDLSISECCLGFLNNHLGNSTFEQKDNRRELFPNPRGPIAIIPAADGLVQLNCPEQRQWEQLVEIMECPDWAALGIFADPFLRGENWHALEPLLTLWSASLTRQEIFIACQERSIPCAPIYTVQDVLALSFNAEGRFESIPNPIAAGRVPVGYGTVPSTADLETSIFTPDQRTFMAAQRTAP